MSEFEEIRDEVEQKIRQAIRYYKCRHGLVDASIYSRKDLGLKAVAEIYQQRDKGICEHEINKAIEKVSWSVKNQTGRKERLALEFLSKTASKGYSAYARLMKVLGFAESFTVRPLTVYSINPLVELINPGGRVFVKSGVYPISSTTGNAAIVVQGKDNVVLEGEGWKSTRLVVQGADTIGIKVGDRTDADKACTDIIIRGFYIDGSNQTTETALPENNDRRFGIELASPDAQTKRVLIEECYLYNTGSDSVYAYCCGVHYVKKCIVQGTRGYWASIHNHLGTPSGPSVILDNHIFDSAVAGIRHGILIMGNWVENCGLDGGEEGRQAGIVGSPNGLIEGNQVYHISSGSRVGIMTWSDRNVVVGNFCRVYGNIQIYINGGTEHIISGNAMYFAASDGIRAVTTTGSLISGNVLRNMTLNGIILEGCQRCIVSDNILSDVCYAANNTYDGIRLQSSGTTHSLRNIIAHNQIFSGQTNLPRYGIYEADANQNYNIIANNIVTNCATDTILRQGVNSVEDNNIEA